MRRSLDISRKSLRLSGRGNLEINGHLFFFGQRISQAVTSIRIAWRANEDGRLLIRRDINNVINNMSLVIEIDGP